MSPTTQILIINQHGENRGDEAAMRAMLQGLDDELGDLSAALLVQFRDTELEIDFDQPVEMLHIKMPITDAMRLVPFAALKVLGVNARFLLKGEAQKIIDAYERSEMVISAPGGPYFGDIYADHELVHWFFVWLARLYKKPLFLYAPSAGPFARKWLNPIRRALFRRFDTLCVREEISQGYLQELLGPEAEVHVTADSAIQQVIEPMTRDEYFTDPEDPHPEEFLVAVSAIEYKFPGESRPAEKHAEYTAALLRCLEHLGRRRDCHFLLIPQLYGRVHSDIPYLRTLAETISTHSSCEIVDGTRDSNEQRRIVGMCDICIASRYHPQIFAGTSGVPGICIYYEHKALGFMTALGFEDFAFDIRNLDEARMIEKLDEAIDHRDQLSKRMSQSIVPVRERARRTTELAAALYRERCHR
jgi:polysaccharide pyruvyl transferase WcaK-like protein